MPLKNRLTCSGFVKCITNGKSSSTPPFPPPPALVFPPNPVAPIFNPTEGAGIPPNPIFAPGAPVTELLALPPTDDDKPPPADPTEFAPPIKPEVDGAPAPPNPDKPNKLTFAEEDEGAFVEGTDGNPPIESPALPKAPKLVVFVDDDEGAVAAGLADRRLVKALLECNDADKEDVPLTLPPPLEDEVLSLLLFIIVISV